MHIGPEEVHVRRERYAALSTRAEAHFDALSDNVEEHAGDRYDNCYREAVRHVASSVIGAIETARVRGRQVYDLKLDGLYAALQGERADGTPGWQELPIAMGYYESIHRVKQLNVSPGHEEVALACLDRLDRGKADVLMVHSSSDHGTISFLARGTDAERNPVVDWEGGAHRRPAVRRKLLIG